MKVAICAERDDLASRVPNAFQDAEYLMIIDADTNIMTAVYPREDAQNIRFAEHIREEDCEVLICGALEKEPFEIIAGAGVTRYDGSRKLVQAAYKRMLLGKLPLIRDHIGGSGTGHTHDFSCECGEGKEEEAPAAPVFDAVIAAFDANITLPSGAGNVLWELSTFKKAGVRRAVIVTGSRREEAEAALRDAPLPVSFVCDPDFDRDDLLRLARAGLTAAVTPPADGRDENDASGTAPADGIFFSLTETPLFTPFTPESLQDRMGMSDCDLFIPTCAGEDGYPLLIRADAVSKLKDTGAIESIKEIPDRTGLRVLRVDVPDHGAILRSDTPEGYRSLSEELRLRQAPDAGYCARILDWACTEPDCRAHMEAVAAVAEEICTACLPRAAMNGITLHPDTIRGAALLHDVLKGMDHHAKRGQQLLEALDMPEVAALVGSHVDLLPEQLTDLNDALILFLADKLIRGDRRITLEEHFSIKRRELEGNPAALKGMEKREKMAKTAREIAVRAGYVQKNP